MSANPAPLTRSSLLPRQPRLPIPTVTVGQEQWLEDSIPTRALIDSSPAHYLARGSRAQADLRLVKVQGVVWVIKDFAERPRWMALTLGRWLINRELAALQQLDGLEGIPQPAVRIDRFAFAYQYVEGVPLNSMLYTQLSGDFFNRLETLAAAVHARGIVHLDLQQGSHIVVTPEQQPVLVGFQAHLRLPRWLSAVLRLAARIDFNAIHSLWDRHMQAVLQAELRPARRIRA